MQTIGSTKILGLGAYLPKKVVTSDELMAAVNSRRFGIPESYISRRIGIVERRYAADDEEPSDLATLASEVALRNSGVTADEIDLLIFTGITTDYEEPSTAHFVQEKLGANRAFCLDVSNACLGFMTGLSVADSYLKSGAVNTVLVCTGELPSRVVLEEMARADKITDPLEFKAKLGFLTAGDGGGAMVLQRSANDSEGLNWINFVSRGNLAKLCHYRKTADGIEGAMEMSEISREIVQLNADMVEDTFQNLDWSPESVEKLYCHQVGAKPHMQLVELARMNIDRAPVTYDLYGNLTSATIPVNMYLNPPNRGERIVFFGVGSGLTVCHAGMVY